MMTTISQPAKAESAWRIFIGVTVALFLAVLVAVSWLTWAVMEKAKGSLVALSVGYVIVFLAIALLILERGG